MNELLLTVAGITVAALLSPGPNFVLITGRALSSGTHAAVAAAVGVAAGSLTHALLGIAGFGALLRSSAALFAGAKLAGAAYLLWIGFKSIRGVMRERRGGARPVETADPSTSERVERGTGRSVLDGYLTQMSNPKSTLFFLALFTTVVPADTTMLQGAAVIATIVLLALAGYVSIAVVFSRSVFQRAYRRGAFIFDVFFGVAMMALGVRVGLTDR